MITKLAIVIGYAALMLAIGFLARRPGGRSHEAYFLANRTVGPILLFLTMAATNFSAFTVIGFSGAGYRIGYAYYPIMAFGTGFMALTFLFIGIPAWRLARELGAVSPAELVGRALGSRSLRVVYALVMGLFTLPYLAIQPIGAGYALQGLFGIPYQWGAVAVTAIIVTYVLVGGMRSVVWTDAIQGLFMLAAMAVVFFGVAHALGGFSSANSQLRAALPGLFDRPGVGNALPIGVWFSYMLLWFLCDPMFPQLFQRFLAARDPSALKVTALLYPLATGVLFFFPVAVGVMGRLVFPGLTGVSTDGILPLTVARLLPAWATAFALVGVLAALMSTMSSQLLTLSSLATRDLPPRPLRAGHRIAVAVLGVAGLAIALWPWAPILQIATETFTGLAVLFPVTCAVFYWRRFNAHAGLAGIVVGEVLTVAYHFRLLPSLGFLPVIPVVLATTVVLVAGSLIVPGRHRPVARVTPRTLALAIPFVALFVLANDFWNWHRAGPCWLGLPCWLWSFFGLMLGLFAAFGVAMKLTREKNGVKS